MPRRARDTPIDDRDDVADARDRVAVGPQCAGPDGVAADGPAAQEALLLRSKLAAAEKAAIERDALGVDEIDVGQCARLAVRPESEVGAREIERKLAHAGDIGRRNGG